MRIKLIHSVILCWSFVGRFTLVSKEDLMLSDETCAICWERMSSARRLPCGHLFHMYVQLLRLVLFHMYVQLQGLVWFMYYAPVDSHYDYYDWTLSILSE